MSCPRQAHIVIHLKPTTRIETPQRVRIFGEQAARLQRRAGNKDNNRQGDLEVLHPQRCGGSERAYLPEGLACLGNYVNQSSFVAGDFIVETDRRSRAVKRRV